MKTLTLLRHAKSSWDSPAASDFDRPLNKRGHRAAKAMGHALRDQGLAFDAVLASPAARVVETLAGVAEGYGEPLDAEYDRRVYLGSAALLLQLVRLTDDAADRLLLVGHNPGLEALALMLTDADHSGLRAELVEKYPTATLAEIAFPASRWREVAAGTGLLARFIRPRDLEPDLAGD
jgi:phosphohistidine phosphatase